MSEVINEVTEPQKDADDANTINQLDILMEQSNCIKASGDKEYLKNMETRDKKIENSLEVLEQNVSRLLDLLDDFFKNRQDVCCPQEIAKQMDQVRNVNEKHGETVRSDTALPQLQLKLELESGRRKRLQEALDDAEKRSYAANKALERKTVELERSQQLMEELRSVHHREVEKLEVENANLQRIISDKESAIKEGKSTARKLSNKAEEFEELFNKQLEIVKKLQSDLAVAEEENKALVKEMEMLNEMFNELEKTHIDEALNEYEGCSEVDLSDTKHRDQKGREVGINEIFKTLKDGENVQSSIQDSCFKEVMTKNGTRMVLSVSKTFMKLKDLILEKKTLEDQMEKMKAINTQLCQKVNNHEAKLFNITDELNKTWNYVSTIKLQHKKLHTSEQILRAELLEKRQILIKLRDELECSRKNWLLVKQKTADSEKEWKALRAEFRARRNEIVSSESGFSDIPTEEEEGKESSDKEPEKMKPKKEMKEEEDEDDKIEEAEDATRDSNHQSNHANIPLFIPSMSFLAEVPGELLPPMFDHRQKTVEAAIDPTYTDIYERLIESTTRSAMLASRLAEVNRTLGREEEDILASTTENEEDEEEVEPRSEEDSEVPGVESPDILSDGPSEHQVDEADSYFYPENQLDELNNYDEDGSDTSEVDSEASLECPFPPDFQMPDFTVPTSSNTSPNVDDDCSSSRSSTPAPALWDQIAVEQAGSDVEDGVVHSASIPAPPPPPPFSLLPPTTPTRTARSSSMSNYTDDEEEEGETEERSRRRRDEISERESESATAVTRLLIKHLPKQMSRLRNEKTELEEKIQDLETQIMQQSIAMREMERRMDIFKREAEQNRNNKIDSIRTIEDELANSSQATTIPITITEVQTALIWSIQSPPKGLKATIITKASLNSTETMVRQHHEVASEDNASSVELSFTTEVPNQILVLILKVPLGLKIENLEHSITMDKATKTS